MWYMYSRVICPNDLNSELIFFKMAAVFKMAAKLFKKYAFLTPFMIRNICAKKKWPNMASYTWKIIDTIFLEYETSVYLLI
jgi:hypothetical protein